jgi:UDP:flavonoid glycosyltransferase YjiC (YdhE family)
MAPKKILFACAPFDGHFSPLTGLAVHLMNEGHEVRWYTQDYYAEKLKKLQIPHYPFVLAQQINQVDLEVIFPERKKINNFIKKVNFDIQNVFVKQGPLYYQDIVSIENEFDFDLLIADSVFTGVPYVKELMAKPVFSIGVLPLSETSRDLAPSGLGLTPSTSFFGRLKQDILHYVAQKILFSASNKLSLRTLRKFGIQSKNFLFDEIIKRSTLVLQSGTPGFEYYRSDMSRNIRFIGPLLPYSNRQRVKYFVNTPFKYDRIILVTQGTVEKDVNKVIVPVLEAFKNTKTLVLATTGGSGTAELKKQYPQENYIIEDFIPFADVLPHCNVFITNGGYGGVMMGIQHKIPMVVAGVHEGKNEICARVGYFKIGINLKTEKPTPEQILNAVNKVAEDVIYKTNISKLAREFAQYKPEAILDGYIAKLFGGTQAFLRRSRHAAFTMR